MLTAKLNGSYRKLNSQGISIKVFRFTVNGNEQDLKEYERVQGDSFRLDEKTGKPLWFTTRYTGDSVNLIITEKDQVVADDTELSKLQSLVEQYGPEVARLIMLQKSAPASAE